MTILGFDTATKTLAVGLKKGSEVFEINVLAERKHLELIFLKIQELLDRSNTDIKDLKAVACGTGPGSFIGSRIGVVAAKTFAQILDIPLIGMPTLDIIAASAGNGDLLIANDAMRGEIFYAFYRGGKRSGDIGVIKPDELKKKIKDEKIIVAGDAVERFPDFFKGLPTRIQYPQGKFLVEIAANKFQKNLFEDHFNMVPLYVREVDARESFIECKK